MVRIESGHGVLISWKGKTGTMADMQRESANNAKGDERTYRCSIWLFKKAAIQASMVPHRN